MYFNKQQALESLDAARAIVKEMTGTAKLVPADKLDELRVRLNIVRSHIDPDWIK